mmetsp:Transcript_20505/g.17895  ORF Transcript_20505/g.17895 Transcript_20505/m.17895 type:complete len:164 (-) Transcript_20505:519-1010(-)
MVDFDYTISTFQFDGQRGHSCFDVFMSDAIATQEFKDETLKLKDKYLPIEHDNKIPREEKIIYMEEWWNKAEKLMVDLKITKDKIKAAIETCNIHLRHGFRNFIKSAESAQVQTFIVSGGILDVIGTILRQDIDDLAQNDLIKLISNIMMFDDNGLFTGFAQP